MNKLILITIGLFFAGIVSAADVTHGTDGSKNSETNPGPNSDLKANDNNSGINSNSGSDNSNSKNNPGPSMKPGAIHPSSNPTDNLP